MCMEQTVTHLFVSCPIAVSGYAVQVLGEMNLYESNLNLVRDNWFFFSSVILHKHCKMVIKRCFAEAHTDRVMNQDEFINGGIQNARVDAIHAVAFSH